MDQNADKLNAVTISKLEKESTNGEGIIYKCFNKSNDVFYIRSNSEECLDIQIDFSNIIF